MAKDNSKEKAKLELQKISRNAEITEAYFVGLLWSDPIMHYGAYAESVNTSEFIHGIWGFFFELGKRMYKEGVKDFDDITVHEKVRELNVEDSFEEFGKMTQIEDAVNIVKNHSDNIEYYYESIKKVSTVRELYKLFGEKVLLKKNKYDYENMTKEQLTAYWKMKVDQLDIGGIANYETENLYIEAEEFIQLIEESSGEMLPFYKSYYLNSMTQGVPRGEVTMFGGYGNSGKSSIMAEKFIMSCIENKEKLIIVLNEENAQAMRQKIVLSIMFHEMRTGIVRQKMVNGDLSEADRDKIRKAFQRMHELMDKDTGLIKVIYMEKYVMQDVEKIVRYWANKGWDNLLIDTHKVSDDSHHDKRWETFVEDMKTIHRFTRKEAGGLNLRTIVNFQLVDSTIRNRYLTFDCIGEGKAAKNEAATVMMFRPIWSDEYEGKKHELKVWKWKKKTLKDGTETSDKVTFNLKEGKTYYLLFMPKCRTGANNDNGAPVLVLEPQFNANHFQEVGYTFVAKDYG